jgi:hypothetical protein
MGLPPQAAYVEINGYSLRAPQRALLFFWQIAIESVTGFAEARKF